MSKQTPHEKSGSELVAYEPLNSDTDTVSICPCHPIRRTSWKLATPVAARRGNCNERLLVVLSVVIDTVL
jgi:hypothetical protein